MPQSWQEHWPVTAHRPRGRRRTSGCVGAYDRQPDSDHGRTQLEHLERAMGLPSERRCFSISALTVNRGCPREWTTRGPSEARSDSLAKLAVSIWGRGTAVRQRTARSPMPTRDLKAGWVARRRRTLRDRSRSPRTNSVRRASGSTSSMRLSGIDPGEFLTINEIRRVPSEQYPARRPSLSEEPSAHSQLSPEKRRFYLGPGVPTGAIVNGSVEAREG